MARKVQGLGPSLCALIHPSAWRDCLETPDGVHYGIPRDCATVRTSTFSALRATKRGPIRPAQRLSRQSLEGVFSEVQLPHYGVLRSSPAEMATWHTNLAHMGDAAPTRGGYANNS